jgi:hypothetical protein
MRLAAITFLVILAGSARGAEPAGEHPYRQAYKKQTFGPKAVVMTGVRATFGEITGAPKGWGRGVDGFGKRVASGFATHVVKNTIEYPIAAARHEDLRYHRSTDTRFGPRLEHALVSTVITTKTTTGKRTVATGEISGAVGSGLISRLWQPAAARGLGAGFGSAGITLGAQAGVNVVQEFWPRHNKKTAPLRPR